MPELPDAGDPEIRKWLPDEQLVPAILAGRPTTLDDLSDEDRTWVVAVLGAAGHRAEEIGARLKCSRRTVCKIRAQPLYAMCTLYLQERRVFADEQALTLSELGNLRHALRLATEDLERTREKLGRLIDAQITGTPSCGRCGTPWDRGNTYWIGTKRECRNCRRLRNQDYRSRRKDPGAVELVAEAMRPDIEQSELTTAFTEITFGEDGKVISVEGYTGHLQLGPSTTALPPLLADDPALGLTDDTAAALDEITDDD